VLECFGKADIVINNATITPMGAVRDVPIGRRDASYGVNLRGPVLLAQSFLPGTLERDHGVFVCVSSVSEAYMRAYEALKAAQVHLGSTLDAELEGTGVHVLTIDPGLVRTPGLQAAAEALARSMGRRWRNSTR
jgi:NAD(P)-dependent dehydrogenase (short-subunit alcohol dehydrogenase family)